MALTGLISPGILQISENTQGRQLTFLPLLGKQFRLYVLLRSGTASALKTTYFMKPVRLNLHEMPSGYREEKDTEASLVPLGPHAKRHRSP